MIHQQEFTIPAPDNFDEMVLAMLNTQQMEGLSVYNHGVSVAEHINHIVNYLTFDYCLPDESWRLPTWVQEYKGSILSNLHSENDTQLYALYHDCGKPYCRIVDENGKQHFPNHAEVSSYIWGTVSSNDIVKKLIAEDMAIHTASSEEIDSKLKNEWSCKDAITLLIASLAEIHSNSKMFGGINSINFKMKFKTVEKRGRQICKKWFS